MHALAQKLIPVGLLALAAGAVHAAVPTHLYELNNSLADTLGGPALSDFGGTLGASSYSFAADQGLTVDGAVAQDVYTIDTRFSFESTSGYRRIVDFKGGASDTGLYNLSTALNFFDIATSTTSDFADGQPVRVTLSRDAAGQFSGYVNGALAISFSDVGGLATFSSDNQTARFFIDDVVVSNESSAGSVDYIAIYSTALSASEIATLAPAVPEPGTYALMLAGLAALGVAARRRQRR